MGGCWVGGEFEMIAGNDVFIISKRTFDRYSWYKRSCSLVYFLTSLSRLLHDTLNWVATSSKWTSWIKCASLKHAVCSPTSLAHRSVNILSWLAWEKELTGNRVASCSGVMILIAKLCQTNKSCCSYQIGSCVRSYVEACIVHNCECREFVFFKAYWSFRVRCSCYMV